MKNEYKYYEFDPGQALIYLLNESIGKQELNAVSCFKSPNRATTDVYSCIKGKFKKVTNQKPFELPDRETQDQNPVELQEVSQSPKTIQNIFKPQKTLYGYTNVNKHVLVLRFSNPNDQQTDCVYILIDKDLQESVRLALNPLHSLKDKNSKKLTDLVLSYFNLSYYMFKEFIHIEHKKYQFLDEITSTLEKTVKRKNDLADEIEDLKNAHKSGLENEVLLVLQKKSSEDGPSIQLSENAKNYILKYQGDENTLLKAVGEAADLVKKMYALNRAPNLEIDLNYIEINMESSGYLTGAPDRKRKEKAQFYLDKYEDAASMAFKFKNKVNIRYLAEYTRPKSVQPPAVSANIGKYKDEIRYLLLSYPQKWMVLRSYFNPISTLADDGE